MRLLLAVVLSLLGAMAWGQSPEAAKLKQGDLLVVQVLGQKELSCECSVLSDGAITGPGFGRLVVAGKTIEQAQALIVGRLKKKLLNPSVSLYFKTQQPDFIFLINAGKGLGAVKSPVEGGSSVTMPVGGVVPLSSGLDLKRLLSGVPLSDDPDQLRLTLTRGGSLIVESVVSNLLRPDDSAGATLLAGNDLVTILPIPFVRVWVNGEVQKPGQQRILSERASIQTLLAASGGLTPRAALDSDVYQVTLTRAGQPVRTAILTQALLPDSEFGNAKLEENDLVAVLPVPFLKVWVSGEVAHPGELRLSQTAAVLQNALAGAGGLTQKATLKRVLVVRKGESIRVDASDVRNGESKPFALEDGDFVFVQPNDRRVMVLGEVKNAGAVLLEDGKDLRASDALALAGGLTPNGSLLRAVLARFGEDGKMKVTQFNLDQYIKLGKLESNPVLQPDDLLMFTTPKGLTASSFTALGNLLSPILVVDTILRRR